MKADARSDSVGLDALPELAQALSQTDVVKRPERKLNESPELTFKACKHRAELFAALSLLAFQSFRIGIARVGGDGAPRPMRHSLSGIRVAENENEIKRRRVSTGEILPGFGIEPVGRLTRQPKNLGH